MISLQPYILLTFMVLVQSIQKGESKTFGDLAKVIAEPVASRFRFRSKIVPCPDRYDAEYSIKSFEREKRATAPSRKHVIHNERMLLPLNVKEFSMNAKNIVSFISFVLNFLVECLPSVLQSHQEAIVGRLDGSSWRISFHGKGNCLNCFVTTRRPTAAFYVCFLLFKQYNGQQNCGIFG